MGICSEHCKNKGEELEIVEKSGRNPKNDMISDSQKTEDMEQEFLEVLKEDISGMSEAALVKSYNPYQCVYRKLGELLLHFLTRYVNQEQSWNCKKEKRVQKERSTMVSCNDSID